MSLVIQNTALFTKKKKRKPKEAKKSLLLLLQNTHPKILFGHYSLVVHNMGILFGKASFFNFASLSLQRYITILFENYKHTIGCNILLFYSKENFPTLLFTIVHIYTVFVTESYTSYNIFFTSARGILYFRDRIYFVVTHNIYGYFVTKLLEKYYK